jgi:hypothetical protein
VVAIVGAIDRFAVRPHVDAVRAIEDAFAPASQEVAVAVEHAHRMRTTIEDVDVVLAVDADCRHVAEDPAVGQLRPVLQHPVGIFAAADDDAHDVSFASFRWLLLVVLYFLSFFTWEYDG